MKWISSLGLLFDIIGVLIIFFNGIHPKVPINPKVVFGGTRDPKYKKQKMKVEIYAYIGLGLILIGFILQLIGSIINIQQ